MITQIGVYRLRRFLCASFILFFGFVFSSAAHAQNVTGKKALIVIPSSGFQDQEFDRVKSALEKAGAQITVASISPGQAEGMMGEKVAPDILLTDADAHRYDAIIFIGGQGAIQYWNNGIAQQLAVDAVNNNKVLAAICLAPVTLANAGVLNGRRATVWFSEADKLTAGGATYTARPVERDDLIITASGPTASDEFSAEILRALAR